MPPTRACSHAHALLAANTAVLRIDSDDPDALAAKLFLLIDTGRTKDALDLMTSSVGRRTRFPFEYAYCLYKEGRIEDALEQLDNVPAQRALDRKRLEGQLYYRLERYDACIATYREILAAPYHEDSVEAKANLVAAYVAAGKSEEISAALAETGCGSSQDESLEISFNVACGMVAGGRLEDAKECLLKTKRIGEETLFDEGLEDDEVAEELAGVDAQIAYIDAVVGEREAAIEGNQRVLDLDGPDELANAVAAANGVLLQAGRNARDRKGAQESLRRLEPFLERSNGLLKVVSGLENRLGRATCVGLLTAYACGSLVANKTEHAREALRSLEKLYPGEATPILLQASIAARVGKSKEALALLANNANRFAASPVEVAAVSLRAQLEGHAKEYLTAADTMGDCHASVLSNGTKIPFSGAPAVVATRNALYKLGGRLDLAEKTALEATNDTGAHTTKDGAWALKQLAEVKLASGDLSASIEKLVQLTRADAGAWEDVEVLKTLPRCIACLDPSRHADVVDVTNVAGSGETLFSGAGVDVDLLEAQIGSDPARDRPAQPDAVIEGNAQDAEKSRKEKRRRKKRKTIYPKSYDPEHPERSPLPDPERWLPKWQRSGNKKLRKKRAKAGLVQGSQGAGKVDTSLDYSTKETKAPATGKQGKKKGGKKGRR